MTRSIGLLATLLIFLIGCDYQIPISNTPVRKIDPNLLGSWQSQIMESSEEEVIKLRIDKKRNSEYSIVYSSKGRSYHFSGIHVETIHFKFIQLRLLKKAEEKNEIDKNYMFVTYEIDNNKLMVRNMNKDVVSSYCQTQEELIEDINTHRNNSHLFYKPIVYLKHLKQ